MCQGNSLHRPTKRNVPVVHRESIHCVEAKVIAAIVNLVLMDLLEQPSAANVASAGLRMPLGPQTAHFACRVPVQHMQTHMALCLAFNAEQGQHPLMGAIRREFAKSALEANSAGPVLDRKSGG